MFNCYICKVGQINCSVLFQHFKFSHALYPGRSLRLKCGEHGRSSLFYTYCGFKKHLKKIHGHCLASDPVDCPNNDDMVDNVCVNQLPSDSTVSNQSPQKKRQLVDMCSSIIAQVQHQCNVNTTLASVVPC